jgi:hypothetical protein
MASESDRKIEIFIARTAMSFLMIFIFIAAILFGHINFIVIVTVIQIISFEEVVGIIDVASGAKSLRFTKSLN